MANALHILDNSTEIVEFKRHGELDKMRGFERRVMVVGTKRSWSNAAIGAWICICFQLNTNLFPIVISVFAMRRHCQLALAIPW
jgi:hypothetical protein